MKLGQYFLDHRYKTFRDFSLETDSDQVICNEGNFTFFHYTHLGKLSMILKEEGGLWARRRVACPYPPEEFIESYLVEGFLSPLPMWLKTSTYYNDLGYELTKKFIGNLLLEVTIPIDKFNIYISDYSHILECKTLEYSSKKGIPLGYDCSNGRECTQAYVNSYIPIQDYSGQHHAPIVQVLRKGEGIAIPKKYIMICELQPLKVLKE
ncbi:hypothetical protein MUG84_03395 [Paenibacillus sp. KQZ6P-2]|uniref:Uncharacterized protein n=1 Tax=Paenibacillus mangrovi TaxID=2931978 RepID=A0A9X2B476_9BACL|nr:hypothetical protein [Paenibacillus mangrovi]MCJ8010788.1 hypothetical protein [Paenibacillus mangrovi]